MCFLALNYNVNAAAVYLGLLIFIDSIGNSCTQLILDYTFTPADSAHVYYTVYMYQETETQ